MRPLNRPMFRYGGPIKEGVMSGIREPKKGGGSMKAALVGHPAYPKTNGREHHGIPLAVWGANILRTVAWPFARQAIKQIPKYSRVKFKPGNVSSKVHKGYPGGSGKGSWQNLGPSKATQKITEWQPTKLGKYFQSSPEYGLITGTGGKVAKGVYGFGKGVVKSPTGLALSGYTGKQIYDALKSDPKKDTDGDGVSDVNAAKAAIGMPENLTLGGGQNIKAESGEGPSAAEIAKSRIEANRKKYYEIMGIDKMGRQATGDALINASRAINELNTQGIGLKEGLKSGKLQNLVIQGISAAMDKPSKTKDAVDAAILKAEITKDIDAEKGGTYEQNAKSYAKMKYGVVNEETVAQAYKDLNFDKSTSFAEDLISNAKAIGGGAVTSDVLNTTIQSHYNIVPTVLQDATTMLEVRKSEDFTNDKDFAIQATKNKPAGIYVVDTVAVAVDQGGNQKVLFSG